MTKLIRIEGNPSFARDPETGAVLNINKTEIARARAAKQARREKDDKLKRLESEVDDLKQMVKALLEKDNG